MKKTCFILLLVLPFLFAGMTSCTEKGSEKNEAYGILCNRTGTVDGNNVDRRLLDELISQVVKNWELDHTLYWIDASASAETEAKKHFQEAYDDLKNVVTTMNRDMADDAAAEIYANVDFDLTWTLHLYHNIPSNIIEGPKEVRFRLKTVGGKVVTGPASTQ